VTEQEIQAVVAPSGDIQGALADVHVDLRRLSIGNSPDILTGGLFDADADLDQQAIGTPPVTMSRSRCIAPRPPPGVWEPSPAAVRRDPVIVPEHRSEPITAGLGVRRHMNPTVLPRWCTGRTSCPVRCVDDARAAGQAGAIVVTVPAEPRYLSAPFSTKRTPPPLGLTDGATSASAMAMTPLPAPNWLPVRKPMLPPAPDL